MNKLTPRYSPALRYGHWLGALLVILAYAAIVAHEMLPTGTAERSLARQYHFLFGIAVLLVTLPRIFVRLRTPPPPISPPLAKPMWLLSKVTHVALYAFLIVQPLLGLTMRQLAGRSTQLPFGDLSIPAVLTVHKELADRLEDVHVTLGTAFYAVIGLHILAALYHAYFRRDDTLRRMM